MRKLSWGFAASAMLVAAPVVAAPPDYQPLGPAYDTAVTLELMDNETAEVPFANFIKSEIEAKVSALHLWSEGSFVNLQDKAQAIVGDKSLTDSCVDKVTVSDVSLTVSESADGTHAELCGQVTYERQLCSRVRVPHFSGRNTTYEDTMVARDTLSTESGAICAAIWLEPDSTNTSFVLDYEVTQHELADTLASMEHPVDVPGLFFGTRLDDAFSAVTEAGFPVPEPLAKFAPSVLDVHFATGFEGMLMMEAEALVPVPEDKVADIVIELLTLAADDGADSDADGGAGM